MGNAKDFTEAVYRILIQRATGGVFVIGGSVSGSETRKIQKRKEVQGGPVVHCVACKRITQQQVLCGGEAASACVAYVAYAYENKKT